ncbi:hypothetical protein LMG29739_00056 [Paraburkholderia solisilvae]|uniref:HTH marR-type domain-containing protein n=2 Tax=Paraburkholderia solisilvae TaxID=624376 RepID=A0A6J5CY73_9BURK|nr:hypothetical protein LMG29739_00056 [Paraburkholderia solisilvae]
MALDAPDHAHHDARRRIARDCLLECARQISRVLTAIYDNELRPFGINAHQFTLLALLMEHGPLSRADLGRRSHHDRPMLTKNVEPLVSRGWVREGFLAGDGRSRPLSLTPQGSALLDRAVSSWSIAQTRAKDLLGEAGVNALINATGESFCPGASTS